MARLLHAVWISLIVAGCAANAGPGPSPELKSALDFAAYPNGKLIEDQAYADAAAVFAVPGRGGFRVYETSDTREQVRAYYERLANERHWSFSGASADGYVSLTRDKFYISISPDNGAYQPPTPYGEGSASPQPSPSPTPWRLRVSANVSF
jgi:hypothetical protein